MSDLSTIRASVDALTERTTASVESVRAELKAVSETVDKLFAKSQRPGGTLIAANDNAAGDIKAERAALAVFARTGDDTPMREIHASMSVGSDPDGGYLVTPARSAGMTRKLFDSVAMRRLARIVEMPTGSQWQEPLDTDEAGASWVGETQSRPETDSPQLGLITIGLDELYAMPKVTQKLLDDSSFDVGSWLDNKINEKFARSENAAFISGNGINKPRGLLTYNVSSAADDARPWGTLQTVVSGGATGITADALRNLVYAVRAPYRQGASWLMSSDSLLAIDKLKDDNNNYLFRPSMAAGVPPTLLGYPIEFDEGMPTIAASSLSIAFGSFQEAYTIVDRSGVKMKRDDLTAKPYVLFYGYKRVGGGLTNSEAVKLMVTSAS